MNKYNKTAAAKWVFISLQLFYAGGSLTAVLYVAENISRVSGEKTAVSFAFIRELKEEGAEIAGLERKMMEIADTKELYVRESIERILK